MSVGSYCIIHSLSNLFQSIVLTPLLDILPIVLTPHLLYLPKVLTPRPSVAAINHQLHISEKQKTKKPESRMVYLLYLSLSLSTLSNTSSRIAEDGAWSTIGSLFCSFELLTTHSVTPRPRSSCACASFSLLKIMPVCTSISTIEFGKP